tara:strand:- start:107 stop:247 length:141 start_codon:yes stop_codon:yes gene_type:complete
MKKLTLEEWGILSVLYLEEFVKRTLIGIFKLYMKFENWNFNRKLPK